MTDTAAILLVVKRIVEAALLGVLISGSIYICLNLIFGEKGDEGVQNVVKSLAALLVVPVAILIFINADIINTVLWVITVCAVVAACIFAFLNGPMNVDDKSKKFWAIFIILYTATIYVILKELIK